MRLLCINVNIALYIISYNIDMLFYASLSEHSQSVLEFKAAKLNPGSWLYVCNTVCQMRLLSTYKLHIYMALLTPSSAHSAVCHFSAGKGDSYH
jgi:hypothetical protein